MPRITIEISDSIIAIFPEAVNIKYLPRKKKKALKKIIGDKVSKLLIERIKEELI